MGTDATLFLDDDLPRGEGAEPSSTRRGGRRRHLHHRGRGFGFQGLVVFTGVSTIGDGLISVALPLLAASLTSSALRISLLLVALRLPWLPPAPSGRRPACCPSGWSATPAVPHPSCWAPPAPVWPT